MSQSLCIVSAFDRLCAVSAEPRRRVGILFWFTVPGQMVLAGRAFTTFSSRMVSTSASSKSRRRPSRMMWPLKRVLALQDGPSILVAHSYGGAELRKREQIHRLPDWCTLRPTCQMLERMKPTTASASRATSASLAAIKKTADGFTYLDPAQFHEYFAADLPAEQAAFMARSQVLNAADNFKAVITSPAWRSKPSWMLVAGKDRTINPDLERWYAERARATRSKSQAPATRSTSPPRRKSQRDPRSCVVCSVKEDAKSW